LFIYIRLFPCSHSVILLFSYSYPYLNRFCILSSYILLYVYTFTQAIGDSLTSGFSYTLSSTGKKIKTHHPYTQHLTNLMSVAQASNGSVVAIQRGIGGENTTHMLARIDDEIKVYSEKSPQLKAVAILGGTNDVLKRRDMSDILHNIISMHEKVLRYTFDTARSKELPVPESTTTSNQNQLLSFCLTIPPIDTVHGSEEINTLRLSLNAEIKRFANNCQERMIFVDLENIYNQSYNEDEHNWCPDFLHFTHKGYDGVANMAHYALLAYLDKKMATREKIVISDEDFYAKCFSSSEGRR